MGERTLTLKKPLTKKIPVEISPAYLPNNFANGEQTNRCYILIGLPGSGKSHWVNSILNNLKGAAYPALICEDDYIDQECRRTNESYNEVVGRLDQATLKRMTSDLFNAALGVGRDIIVDRFNLTEDDRSDILLRLPDHYQKIGIVFTCPINLIYERLQQRLGDTGRPYSRLVIGNMQRRYERPGQFEFDRVTTIDHTCRYT